MNEIYRSMDERRGIRTEGKDKGAKIGKENQGEDKNGR